MKPLIYGYMRVDCDAPDGEVDRIEQHMRRFADIEGFCYATTFYEYQPGSCTAFEELTEELGRPEARPVIVPSFAHLSSHPVQPHG